jgi:hypothetical protein
MKKYKPYDVFDRWSSPDWDDQTREAIRKRLEEIPAIRFFTDAECETAEAVASRIIPQEKLPKRVPIIPWIDEKLYLDLRDGFRYEGLPPQRQAWKAGLAGIEETARILFDQAFTVLSADQQNKILGIVQEGSPPGEIWKRLPAKLFFEEMLCKHIVRIFYTHPIAWNLIGYGGPSAIRGHVRKAEDEVDEWEAQRK